jgi:hypothetical protein
MKAIVNTPASSLEWRDPGAAGSRYELWAGEDLLAALTPGPTETAPAAAETAEGRWTFQRAGFLRPAVHLREEGSDLDLAVFRPGFFGHGHLRFTNGVAFHWRHERLGSAAWSFRGAGGEVLVSLRLPLGGPPAAGPVARRTLALVTLGPGGHACPRVPLLAALGWYLVLMDLRTRGEPPAGIPQASSIR